MNIKKSNIILGKLHTAIFSGHGIDEKIQFIPVGLYMNEDGEFSIVVKNGEVFSLKNNSKKKFCVEDFVYNGVFTDKNIKSIRVSSETV